MARSTVEREIVAYFDDSPVYADGTVGDAPDYASMHRAARIRNSRKHAAQFAVECGHCGDEFGNATDAARHVKACTGTHRRADHRKHAAWRQAR